MAAIICSVNALSILSAASKSILVNMLTSTIKSIYGYTNFITTTDKSNCDKITSEIHKMDLTFTTNILEHVIKENTDDNMCESLKYAIMGVNDILEIIELELYKIKVDINNHKCKYFNYWRSLDCDNSVKIIRRNKLLLDKRHDVLLNILKLNNKLK